MLLAVLLFSAGGGEATASVREKMLDPKAARALRVESRIVECGDFRGWFEGWDTKEFEDTKVFAFGIFGLEGDTRPVAVVVSHDREGERYTVYIDFDGDGFVDAKFLNSEEIPGVCATLAKARAGRSKEA